MAAQTPSPSSQSKPSSPPPAYTEFPDAASQPQSSNMNATPDGSSNMSASAQFPSHAGYGPTPIAQQTQLLPYYDPSSPHAIAEAGVRARWRFIGAMFWALAIVSVASFVTGYQVHLRVHGVQLGGRAKAVLGGDDSWQQR